MYPFKIDTTTYVHVASSNPKSGKMLHEIHVITQKLKHPKRPRISSKITL